MPLKQEVVLEVYDSLEDGSTILETSELRVDFDIRMIPNFNKAKVTVYNLNNDITAMDIYETIFSAWENGCKTIYYTRTIQKNSNIISETETCVSCAN